MANIVVVEDNHAVRSSLSDFLSLKGHAVSEVGDAIELYKQLAEDKYDVAVVDVNLPHHDGFSITEYLTQKKLCSVIIMTARNALEDRVKGYNCGADIYMVKPIEPEELAAAISSLTQKGAPNGAAPIAEPENRWQLNLKSLLLKTPNDTYISLTKRETTLLKHIAEAAGNVISREDLQGLLGKLDGPINRGQLDTLISRLRSKVRNQSSLELPLVTAHNSGFSLAIKIVEK
nr:response regulator transcription factor [uncultured Cohaesibacter sp.]